MTTYTSVGQNPLPVAQGGSGTTTTTGSTNLVYATSPTLVTPAFGAITATSLSLNSSDGVLGTTTNNNATTGYVGEFVQSNIPVASAVSATSGNTSDITSITLSAGDWDIYGLAYVTATTTLTSFLCWMNTSSATQPDLSYTAGLGFGTTTIGSLTAPTIRVNVSSSTTVYLSITPSGTGTITAAGTISARRAR